MIWRIPVFGKNLTHIRVAVVYSKKNPRCYYVSIDPVEVKGDLIIFPLCMGEALPLISVTRASKTKEKEAIARVEQEIRSNTGAVWDKVKIVASRNNLELITNVSPLLEANATND